MKNNKVAPPRWLINFFRWYCQPDFAEDIEGDLRERFAKRITKKGLKSAKWSFFIEVLKLFRPGIIQSFEGDYQLNQYGMFKNYFKTSFRSMARNRLFTVINIIGLAVSMSVGLLIIAFVLDLVSYDDFHEKKDSIYRVITTNHQTNGSDIDFASTSVRAGYKIRETISEVEELTMIRSGFSGDAEVGERKLPIQAFWADNSFLSVFSYPLSHGDAATALREPYSLVLTEKYAQKLFGNTEVLGQQIKFDSLNYVVTGVMKDIPKQSHIQFEALVSFSTVEVQQAGADNDFLGWSKIYMNYLYVVIPENRDLKTLQLSLDELCAEENANLENQEFLLSLQPLNKISIGDSLVNPIGATMNATVLWVLVALTFIVILSASFNYTNLSIARSLKRTREVGIRKVNGALRRQVIGQFITESVMISLLALVLSFPLFLFMRVHFLALHPYIADMVSLEISPILIACFVGLSIFIGIMAGLFPAFFFSRIKALQVLKGISSLRLFKSIKMRKSLIVIQYVFSLIFITTTVIGYTQYKNFITFDLGFNTEHILNINLQGNKAELLVNKLSGLPTVSKTSQSRIITSLGLGNTTRLKYNDDSTSVFQNIVDEHYLPMHKHVFLAGENFKHRPDKSLEGQAIVNEQLIKRFGIGNNDPHKAIGEVVTMNGKKSVIVGVLKDFHYQVVIDQIRPFVIRYSAEPGGYINAKITSSDLPTTLSSIEHIWKQIDNVHQLDAQFYDDQIQETYGDLSMMIKIIGYFAFLAIFISSMGLFGMVVFTTETKLKEIAIRKILGAGEGNLIYLLNKGFLLLLTISAFVALPATYIFFDKIVLTNFAYHQPVGLSELLAGLLGVLLIAFIMIISHTLKATRANPAQTLNDE